MNPKEDGDEDSPMLELKLNLSPVGNGGIGELDSSVSSSEMSPEGSCVSEESMQCLSSPEEETVVTTMLLGGCPRCLMYVMLSESDPKCPRCKSSVLLDFLNKNINKKSRIN